MSSVAHAGGELSVTSTVPGAEIWIDNQPVGQAPHKSTIAAGPHTLRVVADFHEPFVRRIDVRDGRPTKVEARLLPGQGSVEFATSPRGATLVVDGRDKWPLPVRLGDIPPGDHSYVISAPGHEAAQGDFQVRKGQNIYIFERLLDTRGLLTIHSRPAGATVTVDEQAVGTTPLEITGISPTKHHIRLQLAGHAEAFRTVDMADGRKGELRTRMQPEGAHLVVHTGMETAEVYLQGSYIGAGEKVEIPSLGPGRLMLEVRAPDHAAAHKSFRAPPEGRIIYKAELMPSKGDVPSSLTYLPPLTHRWTFWAAVGVGASGVGATSALIWRATQPEDVPTGDVIIVTP